jgi:hypothetical protein
MCIDISSLACSPYHVKWHWLSWHYYSYHPPVTSVRGENSLSSLEWQMTWLFPLRVMAATLAVRSWVQRSAMFRKHYYISHPFFHTLWPLEGTDYDTGSSVRIEEKKNTHLFSTLWSVVYLYLINGSRNGIDIYISFFSFLYFSSWISLTL